MVETRTAPALKVVAALSRDADTVLLVSERRVDDLVELERSRTSSLRPTDASKWSAVDLSLLDALMSNYRSLSAGNSTCHGFSRRYVARTRSLKGNEMTNPISLVVTYDPSFEKFFVDVDATALLFPDGVSFDDDPQYWSEEPLAIEDVMDRLTVQLSAPSVSTVFRGEDSASISTKFTEFALKILDPDFTWEPEETRAAGDEAARYLTEYPITDWEIEGAFGLFVQFVHDWATGRILQFHSLQMDQHLPSHQAAITTSMSLTSSLMKVPLSNERRFRYLPQGVAMTISEPVEFIDLVNESERAHALIAVCATMRLAEDARILQIHSTTAGRIEVLDERELDVTPCVELADVDRTHYYQPLTSAELEGLDSAASLNFHTGTGERL